MSYTESIAAINTLIEIHNDRIQLYNMAIYKSELIALNEKLKSLIVSSNTAMDYLIFEIRKLNGSPIENTTSLGKFAAIWPTLEFGILQKDSKVIVKACLEVEAVIIDVYDRLIAEDMVCIPSQMLPTIKLQSKGFLDETSYIITWQNFI
ncbi:MAG: DUF2383 domain-containing protein [Saprospiraceae bacterium]|nr:DUF2383 domain-containing protein [Saprospiraceae bacterium]